MWDVLEHSV